MGHCKSSAKGKVHSNTDIPQEIRKSQINNLTLHLKQLEKKEMKNPKVTRRKGILKIRTEINAKETKETIAKINKAKTGSLRRYINWQTISQTHQETKGEESSQQN